MTSKTPGGTNSKLVSQLVFSAIGVLVLVACNTSAPFIPQSTQFSYPATKTEGVTDNYHGTDVVDAYRWLEDDVRENADVAQWVDAQSKFSANYLAGLPGRDAIGKRMERLWDYERVSTPAKKGGKYWYSHNDGLANQARVYATDNPNADGELILDPNAWSADGTLALAGYWPGPNGRYLAYTLQDGGTDWRIAKIRDLQTGKDIDDELRWLKFTALSWDEQGTGFYYSRYPAPGAGQKFQSTNLDKTVHFHRLGDAQSSDPLIFGDRKNPEYGFWPEVTSDGRYLVITSSIGTDDRYEVFVQDLTTPVPTMRQLVKGFDHDYTLIGSKGTRLFFRSNKNAQNALVLAFDMADDNPQSSVVVSESRNNLTGGSLVNDTLVLHYLQDAASSVQLVKLDGSAPRTLDLPGLGAASGFPNSKDSNETFYKFSSINRPPTIYRLDTATGESKIVRKPDLAFDPDDYSVRQAFFKSKDGTQVPLFIAAKKTTRQQNAPTLLYGYGGFNITLSPGFSVTQLAWMELGGVYVQANLRGGGEYGTAWHKAGTKLQKQNVFDDFIGAAEYLIEQGITSPKRLGIHGRSNGGLLVGAVVNQRPELFGAALPGVGVMDMLRFQRFTAGRFWTDDYGSSDNPDEFAALYAYSPYHNIASGVTYPPILITTADTDDRVVPGHSFKYAAALQAADTGRAPKLLRVETRSGHGSGKPTSKRIAEFTDMWAFLAHHLGLKIAGSG